MLAFAASARGDEVEHRRLLSSAPFENRPIPEGLFEVTAIATTAMQYELYQMKLVATFLVAMLQYTTAQKSGNQDRLVVSTEMARAAAYAFVTEREGWRLFCEGLGLDPAHLRDDESTNPQLAMAEPMMEEMAYTTEEMAVWAESQATADESNATPSIVGPEDVAAAWRAIYDETLNPA